MQILSENYSIKEMSWNEVYEVTVNINFLPFSFFAPSLGALNLFCFVFNEIEEYKFYENYWE